MHMSPSSKSPANHIPLYNFVGVHLQGECIRGWGEQNKTKEISISPWLYDLGVISEVSRTYAGGWDHKDLLCCIACCFLYTEWLPGSRAIFHACLFPTPMQYSPSCSSIKCCWMQVEADSGIIEQRSHPLRDVALR